MKAILEFHLPEDADEHAYALAGLDCRIIIDNLLDHIRTLEKYEGGPFAKVPVERYDEATQQYVKEEKPGCVDTLIAVRRWLIEQLADRKVPELV